VSSSIESSGPSGRMRQGSVTGTIVGATFLRSGYRDDVNLKDKAMHAVERAKAWPGVRHVVLVLQRYAEERAGLFANGLTYLAFFSIFPLLLVASSILGFFLQSPATQARVVGELSQTIPGFGGELGETISTIVAQRGTVGIIGLVLLAWRGTALVRGAGAALTAINHRDPDQNPAERILWSFGAGAILGLFGLSAIALSGLGAALPDNPIVAALLFAVAAGLDVLLFLVAYRVLSPGEGPPWAKVWPGALIAAAGWNILKYVGTAVASRALTNATATYGSLGIAVGMLVVLSLTTRIFMYGAVVNVLHREDAFREPHGQKGSRSDAGQRVRAGV